MKRIICSIVISSFALHSFSQDTLLDVKYLQTPNSPGFQILDASPSNISRPTSPKQFALSVLNTTGSGSAIPKDFAIEIAPYWFFKPRHEDPYKYRGSKNRFSFNGVLRKLSISTASVYSDSTSGSLLKNTNYISIGFRTTLLTIWGSNQQADVNNAIRGMAHTLAIEVPRTSGGMMDVSDPDKIAEKLTNDKGYQQNLTTVLSQPLFELDIAGAYSEAFVNNDFKNNRFNRSGIWITGIFTPYVNALKGKWGNLSLLGVYRLTDDNPLVDTLKNIFARTTTVDAGVSISYSYKQFSLAGEYVNRSFTNNASLNTYRKTLLLQYKLNSNLYITATYGKNFGTVNNLFALLGLNWGFGSTAIINQ